MVLSKYPMQGAEVADRFHDRIPRDRGLGGGIRSAPAPPFFRRIRAIHV